MTPEELAHHAQRAGALAHWLVWVEGRNLSTGLVETLGVWTGDDDASFTIDGELRAYAGAGTLAEVPPIVEEIGLDVRQVRLSLTVTPEVENLVRGYDLSARPVQIHRAVFNPETMQLVAAPEERFAGTVEQTPIETGSIGSPSVIGLVAASLTRVLTRTVPLVKSNAALRLRDADDGFRRYVGVAPEWQVPWGESKQGA